ncbi:hypothetical protein ABT009_12205 [Streptomyces sp. NPDC002896]|uniref:hypothetical protein n=1 Tax=Streptomyces sp. NPDC002896 TaxID=3154438 RepID=UPI00331FA26B
MPIRRAGPGCDQPGHRVSLRGAAGGEFQQVADFYVKSGLLTRRSTLPRAWSKFCLLTGKPLCLPATRSTTTHRVEVRDGDVYLYPTVTADAP